MEKSILPIIVSHGEGRAVFKNKKDSKNGIINYVDSANTNTMKYPYNPNGSENGANGFTNEDGRITILMPHPERLFSLNQYSYKPNDWIISPWAKFFINGIITERPGSPVFLFILNASFISFISCY